MKPIPLSEPIKRKDSQVDKITMRKPSAGELRGLSLVDVGMLDVDTLIKLLPRISTPAITEVEAEKLSFDDIMAIGKALTEKSETAGNGTTQKQ